MFMGFRVGVRGILLSWIWCFKFLTKHTFGLRNVRKFSEVMETAPIFAFRSEDKIRRFLQLSEQKEQRESNVIGFRRIRENWVVGTPQQVAVFYRLGYWWNRKLVGKTTNKKMTGIFVFSHDTSLGKSSFCRTVSDIGRVYNYCRTDNLWQENFDMDATGDYAYDVFILDGIQEKNEIDFAIFENITDHDVLIKRRGKVGGILKKHTPFIIMSNRSPSELFGTQSTVLTARCMVINMTSTTLFPCIDHIRETHNLPPIVADDMDIPDDYL